MTQIHHSNHAGKPPLKTQSTAKELGEWIQLHDAADTVLARAFREAIKKAGAK